MISKDISAVRRTGDILPFATVEEAWFWFIQAYTARRDGAKIVAGIGSYERPCEPVDIMNVLNRLYRGRRLLIEHIRILHHYGVRLMAPDPSRRREAYDHLVWVEAMGRLREALELKGIVGRTLSASKWI